MPTARKKKATKSAKSKAYKKAATKKSNTKAGDVSQETGLAIGQAVELELKLLDRHPDNRKPKPAAVAKLAESIKQDGQLEPILVRQIGKRYQCLSGETRWLSVAKLKRKTINARLVYDCSDAMALRIVATGNLREDLDPIERARLCKRLCEPVADGGSGLSHTQAGELVDLSRAAVSNAIRILNAPKPITDLVADGRLPESFLREVLPALEAEPKLVAPVIKSVVGKKGFDGSRGEFARTVGDRLKSKTRSLTKQAIPSWRSTVDCDEYVGCWFKPTDAQLAELRPITINRWNGTERRATNVALWKELQKAAFAKWKERQDKKSGKKTKATAAAGQGKGKKETAADLARKQKEQADKLKKRLADFRIDWLRYLIAMRIRTPSTIEQRTAVNEVTLRLLLWSSFDMGGERHDSHSMSLGKFNYRDHAMDAILVRNEIVAGSKRAHKPGLSPHWEPLSSLDLDGLVDTVNEYTAELFWQPGEGDEAGPGPNYCIPAALVNQVAEQLDIKPAEAWKAERAGPLTERFFELHTGDQLNALAKFWKVAGWLGGVGTVKERRQILANASESKKALPKGLAK